MKPQFLQPVFLFDVFFHYFVQVVGKSIQFDDQHQFVTEEIGNVIVQRFLPVKVVTEHLFPFQKLPKEYFRFGAVVPELPGEFYQFWIVGDDVSFLCQVF